MKSGSEPDGYFGLIENLRQYKQGEKSASDALEFILKTIELTTEYDKAQLSHLQKLCEEQKGEIDRLTVDPAERPMFLAEIDSLKSQLATQTERVSVLEGALNEIVNVRCCQPTGCTYPTIETAQLIAEQALNQVSPT